MGLSLHAARPKGIGLLCFTVNRLSSMLMGTIMTRLQVTCIDNRGATITHYTPRHKGIAPNLAIDLSTRPPETVRVVMKIDGQVIDLAL